MNTMLPNALFIGVDYDLFWTLTPKSIQPFYKAFSLRQKHDDELAWQQGAYIRMAIASTISDKQKYPSKPMSAKTVNNESKQDEIKRKFLNSMTNINTRFTRRDDVK